MHEVLQTFRSAVERLDEEPALVFTASSASYYQWVEQTSPELFGRIRELVAQQRWIVTGGQWVEPDCNLPSGESVCRQFLYGQRYLAEHLGITATVGYNIDSFGQRRHIAAAAGRQRHRRGTGYDAARGSVRSTSIALPSCGGRGRDDPARLSHPLRVLDRREARGRGDTEAERRAARTES